MLDFKWNIKRNLLIPINIIGEDNAGVGWKMLRNVFAGRGVCLPAVMLVVKLHLLGFIIT